MLNILSGALTLAAYIPYIAGILSGKTKPHRITWWIWSGVGFLLVSTYSSLGGQAAMGLAIGALIGQVLVGILSIRFGIGGTHIVDRVCLAGAIIAAVLWWLTASAFWPYVLVVIIDGFALFPTFRKSLFDAHSEDIYAWFLWTAAAAIAIINVEYWSVANTLYPLYIVISDGVITLLLLRRFRGSVR